MKLTWLRSGTLIVSAVLLTASTLPAAHAAPLATQADSLAAHGASTKAFNKRLVAYVMNAVNGNSDLDALGRYFAPHLIQHDPALANGREGMLSWFRTVRAQMPAQTLTIKHLLADGNLVFVHSHLSATPANEMSGTNRYDFFRVERGSIVEHWVVAAPAPTSSANGNSVFSDVYTYPGAAPVLSAERVETQRRLVKELSEEVFHKKNFGLLERFWAPGYLQHNPYVPSGRAALASALPYIAQAGSSYRVVRSLSEGDLNVVCSHNVAPGGDVRNEFAGVAVCDMYRVVNLELAEHWDVWQEVPSTSVSGNSMFSQAMRRHP